MAKFIRLAVKEGSQLFNVDRIIRIRSIDVQRTRVYLPPFSDKDGVMTYYVDVSESQQAVELKLERTAGIYP